MPESECRSRGAGVRVPESGCRSRGAGVKFMENTESDVNIPGKHGASHLMPSLMQLDVCRLAANR